MRARALILAICFFAFAPALSAAAQTAEFKAHIHYDPRIFPPWQKGRNNDAINRGVEFTVPEVDDLADFHGDLRDPKLVLYVGGNYFFAMAPLIQAFEAKYPEYKGHVYWETLPPGILARQLKSGGIITCGNMTWTIQADVYLAGMRAVKSLLAQGLLSGNAIGYVSNSLAIMVAKANPAHITSLADLARPDLRLALPNPASEGIAEQIKQALAKVGGDRLVKTVYETKVHNGSALLTQIHHRQTPLFIMQGIVDAGVTWQSEAVFQELNGRPISHVAIAAAQNSTGVYAGAAVKNARHGGAAKLWLKFIRSPSSIAIFQKYGFSAYKP